MQKFVVHEYFDKSTLDNNSAINSSLICQDCGLCCDGVLFSHVTISANAKNRLPLADTKVVENKIKMKFPCNYMCGSSCSVYHIRPNKCKTYSCNLLKSLIKEEIKYNEAKKILSTTKAQVEWIRENIKYIEYEKSSNDKVNFRDELNSIYTSLIKRFDSDDVVFSEEEIEFCLCVLDFCKGCVKYFHDINLLEKYNSLVMRISNTNKKRKTK
jgi:hypothetical protein